MENVAKSEVFFFITTFAVVILTILLAVLIVYLIKVSRDVKNIARKARAEAENIIGDVKDLRENIKTQGERVKNMVSMFSGFNNKKKKKNEDEA